MKVRVLRPEEATSGDFEVLVVDDTTSFLSRRLVDEMHGGGRKVLGVYDEEEFAEGRERLLEMGADAVIGAHATTEEFVRQIAAMRSGVVTRAARVVAQHAVSGDIVVVGGPFGGTGATEIAIGIAGRLQVGGSRTLLVDADDLAPSIAQRLGLPLVPNLRTLVDHSRHGEDIGGDIDDSAGFGVVCGIPNPRDWFELRPADVVAAVEDLAKTADCVVLDVSSGVERLPGDGRYRLARRLISMAGILIGVGVPTPLGVSRLLDWVAEAKVLNEHARLLLVVNRTPRGAFLRSEVAREIERVFEPSVLRFLPMDRRVEQASWAGGLVRKGAFSRGVAALAADAPLIGSAG
ncbi:MAG: hypothetical protein GWP04_02705 [Gammaproteobacteria bacterium]|nr:hypothetical protein [Gammaproteobacteria bacterium]